MEKEILTGNDGTIYHKDDIISLDGGKCLVMDGAVKLADAQIDDNFKTFFSWVNEIKTMTIEANADTV